MVSPVRFWYDFVDMIGSMTTGRVFVFVDAANIFYSQKTLGWRISYERLKTYFEKECRLGKIFVYTARDDTRPSQEKFLSMLTRAGYILRTKPVKQIRVGPGVYQWKGDFDVEVTMDILDHLAECDTVVLLSGDSDFAPVIKRVQMAGKRTIVMSVKGHVSRELLELAKYVNLKKLRGELELV